MHKFMLLNKNKVVISKGNSKCDDRYIATIVSNISALGYILSEELIEVLRTNTEKFVISFYKELVTKIKEEIGFKKYTPLYPDFPNELMEISDFRLFLDSVIHYITKGEKLDYYEEGERFPLMDNVKYTVLELGTVEDYERNFINLLNSKTSISDRNKEYITWFLDSHMYLALKVMPDNIPLKETMCIVVSILYNKGVDIEVLSKYVKTATDVLRISAFMSEGDITLKKKAKYKCFTRKERKFILGLLEKIPNKLEDMNRYRSHWISAGERLHPGDFYKKYPLTFKDFKILRGKGKIHTFNSRINEHIKNKELNKAVDLLKTRPGEFARRLNEIMMLNKDTSYILDSFEEVASKVETTVLWQLREFFIHRGESDIRAFFPKGSTSNMFVCENKMNPLDKGLCEEVVSICDKALEEIYSRKESLGKVYIASELSKYIVPFSERSASKSLRTITRGSRVSISDETSVIRAFIHWKDCPGSGGTDVDLTASLLGEDFSTILDIGYYNLREQSIKCYHSGDVRFAPNGGSEFIDINIESALKSGVRYAVFLVNAYSMENFCDIPECFFGFMERQDVESGEIYEPKTVKNKFDLTSETKMDVTMIFDLKEREFIWVDSVFKFNASLPNNVYNNVKGVRAYAKVMTDIHKTNMYDLFFINTKARGVLVENREEADVAFVLEKSDRKEEVKEVTPYDIEEIIGEYL